MLQHLWNAQLVMAQEVNGPSNRCRWKFMIACSGKWSKFLGDHGGKNLHIGAARNRAKLI